MLAQEISNHFYRDWTDKVDVAVCPPYVDLKPVRTVFDFDKVKISVGAQNVYWEPKGALPGDLDSHASRNRLCVLHRRAFERRTLFGETNEEVNKKTRALRGSHQPPSSALASRLPFVTRERIRVRDRPGEAAFAGIDAFRGKRARSSPTSLFWAIGTGRTATPEQAEEVCARPFARRSSASR